jgi:hypothetical protein
MFEVILTPRGSKKLGTEFQVSVMMNETFHLNKAKQTAKVHQILILSECCSKVSKIFLLI